VKRLSRGLKIGVSQIGWVNGSHEMYVRRKKRGLALQKEIRGGPPDTIPWRFVRGRVRRIKIRPKTEGGHFKSKTAGKRIFGVLLLPQKADW